MILDETVDKILKTVFLLRFFEDDFNDPDSGLWFVVWVQIVEEVQETFITLLQPVRQQFVGDNLRREHSWESISYFATAFDTKLGIMWLSTVEYSAICELISLVKLFQVFT